MVYGHQAHAPSHVAQMLIEVIHTMVQAVKTSAPASVSVAPRNKTIPFVGTILLCAVAVACCGAVAWLTFLAMENQLISLQ